VERLLEEMALPAFMQMTHCDKVEGISFKPFNWSAMCTYRSMMRFAAALCLHNK
jgi:hypothetical protein